MKLSRKPIRLFVLFFISLAFARCASSYTSDLETARFELDQGNYTAAITAATSAVQSRPGDIQASRILANAYLGRSGIDFLELAEGLTTLQDSADPNFGVIAGFLPTTADLDDLRTAITTLEAVPGVDDATITNEDLADATFDLAIMQMIESFALGVYHSNFFTTLDVTQIVDADRSAVQDDLIDFDNRIIASGIDSDEQFIAEVRQTFCILEPISAGAGFTVSEYRTLVNCQLSSTPDTVDTTAIDAGIANCSVLIPADQSADVQACYNADTTL